MISFDDFFNFIMAIFLIVFCIWFYSRFFKFVFKLITFPFKLILAPFKFIKSIFTGSSTKSSATRQQVSSVTKKRSEKMFGFLKKAVIAGAAVKTYQAVYNRPYVTPPHGYVVRGISQVGIGNKWKVKYSQIDRMNSTSHFYVTPLSRKVSIGGNQFVADFPES